RGSGSRQRIRRIDRGATQAKGERKRASEHERFCLLVQRECVGQSEAGSRKERSDAGGGGVGAGSAWVELKIQIGGRPEERTRIGGDLVDSRSVKQWAEQRRQQQNSFHRNPPEKIWIVYPMAKLFGLLNLTEMVALAP